MSLATWLRALVLCFVAAHICCGVRTSRQRQLEDRRSTQLPLMHSSVVPANASVAQDNAHLGQYEYRPRYYLASRATPPEVAKYRYEGNYHQPQPQPKPLVSPHTPVQVGAKVQLDSPLLRQSPITFDQHVWHVEREAAPSSQSQSEPQVNSSRSRYTSTPVQLEQRGAASKATLLPIATTAATATHQRRTTYAKRDAAKQESAKGKGKKVDMPKAKVSCDYHDIYQRYDSPQQLSFGHVERRPAHYEQRFATLNKGNRYRGEVLWADAAGGYGEHRWDMAQGKLRR